MDKINTAATVLIVPGLRDFVAEHWQTHLQARLCKVRSVPPLQHDKLSHAHRVAAIQAEIEQIEGPIVIVAHSAGVLMTMHWAAKYQDQYLDPVQQLDQKQHLDLVQQSDKKQWIQAALLVAPPNLDQAWPDNYPTPESMRLKGWDHFLDLQLAFPSVVIASRNDPLASFSSVERMAQGWGSALLDLGDVGHLNPAAGYGYWPLAEQLVQQLDQHSAIDPSQFNAESTVV